METESKTPQNFYADYSRMVLKERISKYVILDVSRKKGIAVICLVVAGLAIYFIWKQHMRQQKSMKEDKAKVEEANLELTASLTLWKHTEAARSSANKILREKLKTRGSRPFL